MAASVNFPKLPEDWVEKTHVINLPGGKLFTRLWHKKNFGRGRMLFIVHGQGEQSGRYEHFPFYLQSSVDAIAIFDLPGHGQSFGVRGHCESFEDYSSAALASFNYWSDFIKKENGQLTTHWLGHSLGGLITLKTLIKTPGLGLKSVCASAPLLGLAMPVPKLKAFFGVLLAPLIGKIPLTNELDPNLLSHDPSVVGLYGQDPLNHNKVTSRFFINLNQEMSNLQNPNKDFPYPLMLLVPLADKIVSWKAAFSFFEKIKMQASCKKEFKSLPNFFHEAFNETEKGRAFVALEDWINGLDKSLNI